MDENESQNLMNLNEARKADHSNNPVEKAKSLMSFRKKISKHWVIILAAVLFDIAGLIPFISVLANLAFGFILFLYFGPKKKANESDNLLGIVLPIILGSAFDWFLSVIPVNISAALVRIALSDDTVS